MPKQSVVDRAARAAAAYGESTDAVDRAAAALLRVNRTDLSIIGTLAVHGPQSAGALAVAVGLSPAATTEAVQRLVGRGLLARQTDPADRRRAVITVVEGCADVIARAYGPVEEHGRALLQRYSAAELATIADFLERGRALQLDEAARIRELAPPVGSQAPIAAG